MASFLSERNFSISPFNPNLKIFPLNSIPKF